MEPVYIVMICSACVFAALLLIYFLYSDKAKKETARKQEELERAYSDKNLAKMEYDIAFYDDELPVPRVPGEDKQVTIDDVIGADEEPLSAGESAIFTKADDGMEEISGHYEPEDQ